MRGRRRFLLWLPPLLRVPIRRVVLFVLGAGLAAGCMDLDVTNVNEPDAERVLANAGDVSSLISAAYNSWFNAVYSTNNWNYGTAGFILSNQAFQHSAAWLNWGMEKYGRIPRVGIQNNVADDRYGNLTHTWEGCYQALSALAHGLKALEDPAVGSALGPDALIRHKVYGRFVQGLAHGTVALLYARGFVLDETTDLEEPQVPLGYASLMERALAYLDEATTIGASSSFTIPYEWMQAEMDSQHLIRLAHSYKARFRAQIARTPEERAEVDWDAVLADLDAGMQDTHNTFMDWDNGWQNAFVAFATWYNWSQLPYFIYGMADQGGDVAEWYALPFSVPEGSDDPIKRHLLPDGRPVLIVTPDLRFPQGTTVEEQRANEGMYFRIVEAYEEGGNWSAWRFPERGTWRWSWYKAGHNRGLDYWEDQQFLQPELTLAEMRLLKAEGLYRTGDLAGAAAIVNETRTLAGLNATDGSGTNTSCVPKLPDGSCGDLWEMLKWEKRLETIWTGIAGVGWFFDGRGWGDLWKDTPLQFPIPCTEAEVLGMTPCNSFGGPSGSMGSTGSTYNFPFER